MSSFILLLSIILVLFCFTSTINSNNDYENNDEIINESEYYYYDDESQESINVSNEGDVEPIVKRRGYHRNVGGGLLKISHLLVNEGYLNDTAAEYDCVLRRVSQILEVEFDEDANSQPSIESEIAELRRKADRISDIASKLANGTKIDRNEKEKDQQSSNSDTDQASKNTLHDAMNLNETAMMEKVKKDTEKRMSFRQKQELKMKERREKETQKEKLRPKFRLGADCEALVCGSCKALVEEFGKLVYQNIENPSIMYIEDITTDFCKSKVVSLKYVDMVGDICSNFEAEHLGYKEALIQTFEEDDSWDKMNNNRYLFSKKQKVCTAIGACNQTDFEFISSPSKKTQDQWDEKCFTCQAFAKDLEERSQLTRHVTENNIVGIVADTCDRIKLEGKYDQICRDMTKGKLLDDIAWLAKVHGESVIKRAKAEVAFPDKLCEEIDFCKPWVEPEKLKEQIAQKTMEQVFF
eukprot:gene11867-15883_t